MADPKKDSGASSQNVSAQQGKIASAEETKQVNYSAIKLSVPEIIAALHQKAIDEVKDKTIRIANSAIESDGKTAKLNSAGQHIISVLGLKEEDKVKKSVAIESLKTYVQWFVGPDLAAKVTEKVVLPFGENGEESSEEQQEENPEETSKEENSSGEETSSEDNGEQQEEQKPTGESLEPKKLGTPIEVISFKKFLTESCNFQLVTEENEQEGDKPKEKSEDASSDQPKEKKEEDKKDPEALGWYIAYNLKIQGMKESSLKDSMKQFATSFFDNLKLTASGLFGGGDSITGKDIRKQFHDLAHVDHEKLAKNVDDYLRKKFPNVKELDVKTRDAKTLYREIKSYPSLTKDEKSAIANAPYSLWIKVKEENPQKPFLNKIKIADAIRKCMGFFRIGKKAQVTKDSIIKIEDFVDKNDEQSFANNAKRPSASELKQLIDKRKPKSGSLLKYSTGLELYNEIKKKFNNLTKNKKAMEEKENKEAVAILKKLEDKYKKVKDGDNFDFSMFKSFYEEYLKFENSLGESMPSFSFLSKKQVVSMLLEELFSDLEPMQVLEKDDEENADEAKPEGEINYTTLRASIKKIAREWITSKSFKTSVASKDDAISHLEDFYDTSSASSSQYNSFAIIDFHPDSNIVEESLEAKIMSILFEDADDSNKEDVTSKLIQKVFNAFKSENKIDDAGELIKLEVELKESIKHSLLRLVTEEAEDDEEKNKQDLTKLKKDLRSDFEDLGATKMKNPKLHHTYPIEVGSSEEVVAYLQKIGIGSSEDFDAITQKPNAAALVIKKPKQTEEKMHGGSHGSAAFTDEAVENIFRADISEEADVQMHTIEGTSTAIKYNNSKELANLKVFIALFDAAKAEKDVKDPEPDPDDKDPKPDGEDPKPEDKKKPKTARAFLLPFNAKPEEKPIPEEPEQTTPPEETDDDKSKAEGTDLYIFPIASAKDFEEGADLEK